MSTFIKPKEKTPKKLNGFKTNLNIQQMHEIFLKFSPEKSSFKFKFFLNFSFYFN